MRTAILFALALPIMLQAQTTFAPIGAKWTYKQGHVSGPDTNQAVVEVIGDTLLGGHSCSKLELTAGWSLCAWLPSFIRSSNDSTLYWDEQGGSFELLFRWNAVPNDSWSTTVYDDVGPNDTLDWMVTDTAHVVVDGYFLRVLTVQVTSRNMLYVAPITQVTERLGPSWSPFTWASGACDAEYYLQLRCYEDVGITWQNPQVMQCDLGVGIEEHDGAEVLIRPSLVFRGEPINITGAMGTLAVFDATGRQVSTYSISGDETISLDCSGAYALRLSTVQGDMAVGRVLVQGY